MEISFGPRIYEEAMSGIEPFTDTVTCQFADEFDYNEIMKFVAKHKFDAIITFRDIRLPFPSEEQ